MPTCSGCNPVIDSWPVVASTGVLFSQQIAGNGVGALSGVTNFVLATAYWTATTGINGKCTGYTGRFEGSTLVTGGSGIFSWNGSTYTCTGMGSCVENFTIRVQANPALGLFFPNTWTMYYNMFSPAPNTSSGISVALTANASSATVTWNSTIPCNSSIPIYQEVYFLPTISGLGSQGYIEGRIVTTGRCTACVSGA